MQPALNQSAIVTSIAPGIYLTAAEMCRETQVFPKLHLLTNHNRLLLQMQVLIKWALQANVAKNNSILRDGNRNYENQSEPAQRSNKETGRFS